MGRIFGALLLILVLGFLLFSCVGFVNMVQGAEVSDSIRRLTCTLDKGLEKATSVCLGVVIALGLAAVAYVLSQAAKPLSQAFTMKQFGDNLPMPIQRGQGVIAPGFRIEPLYEVRTDASLLKEPVIEEKRLLESGGWEIEG